MRQRFMKAFMSNDIFSWEGGLSLKVLSEDRDLTQFCAKDYHLERVTILSRDKI